MSNFKSELIRLGLKDKEAAVYLACLELSSSPVQKIARKAKVVRATCYVILESLMKMGLVTKFEEGKKTMFSAEPPRQLMRLLEKQREEVEEKQEDLEAILPELQALVKEKGTPAVRFFEGLEGLRAIRQEMVMYSKPGDILYNFTPIDYLHALFPKQAIRESEESYQKQRIAKRIRSKTIFTSKHEKIKEQLLSGSDPLYGKLTERRFVPFKMFPFASGFSIYGDRIAIGSFTGKMMGVVIESKTMSDSMRSFFELAWLGVAALEENKGRKKST